MRAYRWDKVRKCPWYVSATPGDGGVDWAYTGNRSEAIVLSPYWQKRFAADMRRVGDVANFTP